MRERMHVYEAVVIIMAGSDFDGSRVAEGMQLISQTAALCKEWQRKTVSVCVLRGPALFNRL